MRSRVWTLNLSPAPGPLEIKRPFDCVTLRDMSVGIMNKHLSTLFPVVPVNSVDMFHKLKDILYPGLAENDRF